MQNQSAYEQKRNNGKGIFYGVIAVATLIVAIIGATFAYFTAQASSTNGALSAVAAHVEVNYTEGKQLTATNLIPASASVVAKAYAQPTAYEYNVSEDGANCTYNGTETAPENYTVSSSWKDCTGSAKSTGDAGTKCVDDNGYYVCAVYQFSVTNTSNVNQTLSAYLSILSNSFTTVDETGAKTGATTKTDSGTTSNGALKYMTVRSDSIIDVTAISSSSDEGTCPNNLYSSVATSQTTLSTRFCTSTGSNDVQADGTSGPETVTDANHTYYYYYFNTTAVRQSMLSADKTQTVFSNEILTAVDSAYTTRSNALLYMHKSSSSSDITEVGTTDTPLTADEVWADNKGNSYDSESACTTGVGTSYGATCTRVYLSTESDPYDSNDKVYGVYGQVTRTYYIVAWLEENNPNDEYTDASGDNITQDADQDASFSATINVTSGSEGSAGITGTIK